jgi:hypothetical protein
MSLRDDILGDPACAEALAARDCIELARIRSVGRTKANNLEIGNGTILSTIGLVAGNSVLDEINTNPDYRYVKPLVEQGRLLIGTPLVVFSLGAMVTKGVLTQALADRLIALGRSPNPYTPQEVAAAMFSQE